MVSEALGHFLFNSLVGDKEPFDLQLMGKRQPGAKPGWNAQYFNWASRAGR